MLRTQVIARVLAFAIGYIGLAGTRLDVEAIRRYLDEKPLGIDIDEPGGRAGERFGRPAMRVTR